MNEMASSNAMSTTAQVSVEPPSRSKWLLTLMPVVLIVLNLIVYLRVVRFEFVNWDDNKFIVNNFYYPQGLTPQTIWWALTSNQQGFWIPVTRLSFLIDGHVWKMHAGGFHFSSLLIHLVNTLLCFSICRRMLKAPWKAFLISAIFAVHPLHAESVCWVNDRNDLLCGLFWLAGMSAYISYSQRPRVGMYLVVLLMMSISAMAKPLAATFPFAMLLLDFWPLYRWKSRTARNEVSQGDQSNETSATIEPEYQQVSLARLVLEKIPLIAAGIFFIGFTWFLKIETETVITADRFPLSVRMANAVDSYANYVRQMVWPNDLRFFYPHPHVINMGKGVPVSKWLPSLAIVLAISTFCVLRIQKQPYLFVGWCWFLGVIVPAIGIIQVGEYARADRYMYIPMMGLTIAIIYGAEALLSRFPAPKMTAAILSTCMLVALTVLGIRQAETWRRSENIYLHAVSVDPHNYNALINLGNLAREVAYHDKDNKEKHLKASLQYFELARKIVPKYARVHNNIGVSQIALGNVEEGMKAYRNALACNPNYVIAYQNMGNYYFREKNYDKAIECLSEALKRESRTFPYQLEQIRMQLSACYYVTKQEAKAMELDRLIYEANPQRLDALERIAWALATSPNESIRNSEEAIELANLLNRETDMKSPVALDTLAAAYAEAGSFNEAVKTVTEALELARQAKNEKLAKEMEERYRLYLAGKPYRQSES